jgi:Flp pilus assembly protein TadD
MSRNKTVAAGDANAPGGGAGKQVGTEKNPGKKGASPEAVAIPAPPPLFRKSDWICFAVTTLVILASYIWTLAPDVTLEDSGELAVGSYYAGVPHPPGYPVWTIYTWLFTVLVPISNIAWRVALSSAVASAISCGLIGLLVSRGSSMMIEGIASLKGLEKRWENALCIVAGFVAGGLMGFNGFMWSQSVIVEVYTLSVLSLMGTLCCLLRWIYAPHQRKYLYWTMFLFGICFTNHQTLLVAAMGIQVAIIAANPKLGRDMMAANSAFYILGLIIKARGGLTSFESQGDQMNVMFIIFNMVGISSMGALAWLYFKTEDILTEWKPVILSGVCWVLGAMFYFYMPLASMTNPPMNWGYPRTVEGFKHALTRGQYEKANPSNFIKDPIRFAQQIGRYAQGAIEEFNLVYLAIAIIPLFFFTQMQHRERAWILGLGAVYLCLAIILLILLNPQPDKQSLNLNKVFFTSSHVMLAMGIGYGIALGSAWLMLNYEEYRRWALVAGGAAVLISVWVLLVVFEDESGGNLADTPFYRFGIEPSFDPLVRFTAIFSVVLAGLFVALIATSSKAFPIVPMLALFTIMPVKSMLSHWDGNEQRGHLFGYWFGHDMFTPPFEVYEPMAKNAVLFGGTDPGRFNPTYMIFCESFTPASKKRDPEFDRRDVYLITQNALADGTYLSYIRAHYFRSDQKDPPFFQELVKIGPLKVLVKPLDVIFTSLGAKMEERRRAQGVYPPKEIYTPSLKDSQKAFDEYMADAIQRKQNNQLQPGEDVRIEGNRVSVSGQVSVMAINALLTKVIFDKNPEHEFYVEESFPLPWMYPYQTPFGIIMKINREPVKEFTEEIIKKDHEFWTKYSERLTGNWVSYDTSIKEICEFADRVYRRRNFDGFTGDRKFVRDENGQKAFSKLRSAIAGLYVWRINHCAQQMREIDALPLEEKRKKQEEINRIVAEQQRVIKEADFAYKQAFAFCPYSPEAVFKYTSLLTSLNRLDDAFRLVETGLKFDPENPAFQQLRDQLSAMTGHGMSQNFQGAQPLSPTSGVPQAPPNAAAIAQMEQKASANPDDLQAAFDLITAYIGVGNTNRAFQLLEALVKRKPNDYTTVASAAQAYIQLQRPNDAMRLLDSLLRLNTLDAGALTSLAHMYSQLGQVDKLEATLTRLTAIVPDNPEAWYDLAAIRAVLGSKNSEALRALSKAAQLSNARLAKDPKANNLQKAVQSDNRFDKLRTMPGYQQALQGTL